MRNLRWICLLLFIAVFGTVGAQFEEIIEPGQIVEDELTDDTLEMRYRFSLDGGERITITASSRQFDTLLRLENDSGNIITSNDDSNGSLNSLIDDFEMNQSGDYIIVVTSSNGAETGDFTLTYDIGITLSMVYGDTIEGALDVDANEVVYEFEGTKGDIISIAMQSEDFDSFLELSNRDTELTTDDDSGGSLNSLIASYTIPKTGTYYITARSFSTEGVGDFTLSLYQIVSQVIEYNTPFDATIDGEPLYFVFDGQVGDIVSIRVRSDDGLLDTSVNLINNDGLPIASDDDGGYIYDPEINDVSIDTDGEFVVIVSPVNDFVSGDFTIEIIRQQATILECGSTELILLSDKRLSRSYQLITTDDQLITVTVSSEDSLFDTLDFWVQQNGIVISPQYDESNLEEVTLSISAKADDTIDLIITSYAYISQSFQMDVSCT